MRRAIEPTPPEPTAEPQRRPRAALDELNNLGVLYGLLNYIAPLVRLAAIGTFVFGHSDAYRQLLGLVIAAIVLGAARPALFILGGKIAVATSADAADGESSKYHQLRLVWSQGVRVALFVVLYIAVGVVCDPLPFGISGSSGNPTELVFLGLGVCAFWSVLWGVVHHYAPREKLAMADGTHDLTSASEDEILAGMPPHLARLSLAFRMASILFETLADVLLLYVFLPSALEGIDPPSARREGETALANHLVSVASALVYGSQHLRFRGEWLLCSAYGLILGVMTHILDGQLLPAMVGAAGFAVFRHARRTGLDVRKFRAN